MAKIEGVSLEDFERCVTFHGHICRGLAIGFQAARALSSKSDEAIASHGTSHDRAVESEGCRRNSAVGLIPVGI